MNRTVLKAAATALWGPRYLSQMARELDVHVRTATRWETGDSPVPQYAWERLAKKISERKAVLEQVLAKLPVK